MPSRNPDRPPADLLSIPPESVSQRGPYHFNSTSSAALPVPSQHLLWINKSLTNHYNLFFLPSHIAISHPQIQHKIVAKPQATPARNLSRLLVDFLFFIYFSGPIPKSQC